ncbi:MAG: Asp-tRNA(Asn)/Glu-tRNA(Gln) amidotransferase subunit GatA [Candidatus Omnitrophica bacterium]|nr:Asp-tRNA(Asn)/Glu-tRNA(Gln) amidotransferase subunit GatA [Candidatus Omnitrophota bacterium]MDE2008816.1 Asp-tRNA(Asn)/Glu-tRNA(Gln) amidotransferase subunit GatA [Candidatus Omnitrophota bacterium]MDE2230478.1 Asp-tRNA(Asn)/Glu-tRNA(Gln) amidotransferase subunit GatA [Candidatus Omnitrophota bacterium]
MNLPQLTAHDLLDVFKSGKASPKEAYEDVLRRIKAVDPKVKAYVRPAKNQPDFKGGFQIPIALKDNLCTKQEEITCASRILKGFISPYDAGVVEKVKKSGGAVLGFANQDEFAFGSSCETSCYGPTFNPWDLQCVPGGSSGGSAAAVAADEAVWALGSDTGGSIRQPASFCGIVGLKPTYGRVSRYGLIAFASSLDQIGPLTKDVRDCALLLNIIAGYDERDSTCVNEPVPDYTKALVNDVRGLKIGVPKEAFAEGLDAQVRVSLEAAIDLLKKLGAVVTQVHLPHTPYAVATYYIVATAEASSNLARFDGVRYGLRVQPARARKNALVDMYEETRSKGFGAEAKRRIMLGTYALSSGYYDAYYLRGQKVRTLIKNDLDEAFKVCDVVLTPTSPTVAFKVGEKMSDPLSMYLSDIYTIPANLAGIPAISVPCGFSKGGLPIGMQLMGKAFDEEMLLRVSYTYEQNTEWHTRKPNL